MEIHSTVRVSLVSPRGEFGSRERKVTMITTLTVKTMLNLSPVLRYKLGCFLHLTSFVITIRFFFFITI